MTDISKCNNENCKIKNRCKRYLAETNELYQSYIEGKEIDEKCDFFYEVKKLEKNIQKLKK